MYLTHEDLSKYWVLDCETDDLRATRIWCACAINVGSREVVRLVGWEAIQRFIEANQEAIWVGHNIVPFDRPTINRLCNTRSSLARCVDTLILSTLYDPNMPGGHSLEAWGLRLKKPKGDFHDWTHYSEAMLDYCEQDCRVTLACFLLLTKRMRERGFSERSCKLEHEARDIIARQQQHGFWFDIRGAQILYSSLRERTKQLELPIHELFPPVLKVTKSFQYRVREDGEPYASYQRHLESYEKISLNEDGTYDCWTSESFNVGSPQQRVQKLLSLGWIPTEFTPPSKTHPKGQPQVNEDSLLKFFEESKEEGVGAIAEWLVANGRANMINTWLGAVNYDDSRIHGTLWLASTRRYRHSGPNTANIPSNDARYGRECRSLWGVDPSSNKRLLGYDVASAQMRIFAHYLNNPGTVERYITGDPHQANADSIGIERPPAKNVFYAFIFGAQAKKLAATAGHIGNTRFGKRILEGLYDANPGLRELTRELEDEYYKNDGFISCIDGGYVRCPSPHAALCYRIQSAESCLTKQSFIFIDQRARVAGLNQQKVGDIHDEGQHEVDDRDAEHLGKISIQAIRDAGEELGFNVPMDASYKIGANWSETHG